MGPDPGGPGGVPADIAARLVRALDTSPSTVVALISEDLRNLWVSRSVAWVLGDDPATVMTEKALTRVHPDDVHRLLHGLAQAKAAAPGDAPSLRVVEPLRFRVERPDGGWLALESLVINLLDDPVVNGLVAIVRPVGGGRRHPRRPCRGGCAGGHCSRAAERRRPLVARHVGGRPAPHGHGPCRVPRRPGRPGA